MPPIEFDLVGTSGFNVNPNIAHTEMAKGKKTVTISELPIDMDRRLFVIGSNKILQGICPLFCSAVMNWIGHGYFSLAILQTFL
jgi:hypothetical protein